MSNPYDPPERQTENRSAKPWIILSCVLFAVVIFLGVALYRVRMARQMAMEEAMRHRAFAEEALRQSEAARNEAESVSKP